VKGPQPPAEIIECPDSFHIDLLSRCQGTDQHKQKDEVFHHQGTIHKSDEGIYTVSFTCRYDELSFHPEIEDALYLPQINNLLSAAGTLGVCLRGWLVG